MNGKSSNGVRAEGRGSKPDRRHVDVPLGKKERRFRVERRLPVLDEADVSFAEWVKYMANFIAARRK